MCGGLIACRRFPFLRQAPSTQSIGAAEKGEDVLMSHVVYYVVRRLDKEPRTREAEKNQNPGRQIANHAESWNVPMPRSATPVSCSYLVFLLEDTQGCITHGAARPHTDLKQQATITFPFTVTDETV